MLTFILCEHVVIQLIMTKVRIPTCTDKAAENQSIKKIYIFVCRTSLF